jgi:putative ABC transport system permease protein
MQLFNIAIRSLLQHRLRTSVLAGAIALVTLIMGVILGVAEGLNRTLIQSSTTLMSGHVNVGGFFKPTAGQAAPAVTRASEVTAVIKKAVPELKYIAQRGRGWAKVISETNAKMFGLSGIDIENELGLQQVLSMKEGSLDGLKERGTIVLFEEQARDLEVKVGEKVTISAPTARGVNNTIDVTVVGIAKSMGLMSQFSSFMNAQSLRDLYQFKDDTTGALQVYLPSEDLVQVKQVQERLRKALGDAGYKLMADDPRAFFFKFENVSREAWTGQKLDVTNWRDEVSFVSWTVDLMNIVAFVLGMVMLAIVGVGIMIVMWISIRERTREIGALRAIGMQRESVLVMFLLEGFSLATLSTIAGAIAGVFLSTALNSAQIALPMQAQLIMMSERLVVVPTWQWALSSSLFIIAVITLISLIPSFIAARAKPVVAMSHVD